MIDPVPAEPGRRSSRRTPGGATLEVVAPDHPRAGGEAPDLLDKLAAALRQVRGYVPDHIWWDAGAADVLFEYHALREC